MFEGQAVPAGASVIQIENVPLGKVVNINGQKFVKVDDDPINGSKFIALEKVILPCFANQFNGMNMQDFTTENCDCLPIPIGTGYTLAGVMQDARDGKSYEIRKFADGKCWMVDNLAYGGATDACASKTTFSGNGSATPTNIFGTGTFGDCRNNPGSPTYGYLYNWQAVMQHASAYYNSNYIGPTTKVQGICPVGWYVPAGYTSSEYLALSNVVGTSTNFWRPGGNWKGVFSGISDSGGHLQNQRQSWQHWTSTQNSMSNAYFISCYSSMDFVSHTLKGMGYAVRCIKN